MNKQDKILAMVLIAIMLGVVGFVQNDRFNRMEAMNAPVVHFHYDVPYVGIGVMLDGDNDITVINCRKNDLDGYVIDSGNVHRTIIFDPAKEDAVHDFNKAYPGFELIGGKDSYEVLNKKKLKSNVINSGPEDFLKKMRADYVPLNH